MTDRYKQTLRTTLKQARSNIAIQYRLNSSLAICNKIKMQELYRKAKHVAFYSAINGEIDLNPLWAIAPMQGKFCYFPKINDDLTLSFLPATPRTSFRPNRFGIFEPDVTIEHAQPAKNLDLIFIPTLGFDSKCSRLGMGLGCYDRSLTGIKNTVLLGVAYQFQLLDFIYPESWDIPLDAVITEKATFWRN